MRLEQAWMASEEDLPEELPEDFDGWLQMVHPDDRPEAVRQMERLLGGDSGQAAFQARILHGEEYHWSVVKGRVSARGADGEATEVSGIWLDIEDAKRASEDLASSQRRFETFTDLTPVAIMIHRDGVWTYANRAAVSMLGIPRSRLVGMPYWHIVHPEDREMVRSRGEARRSGGSPPAAYQMRVVTGTGEVRWADLRATALEDGSVLIAAQDITERKRSGRTRDVLLEIARKAHSLEAVGELYPEIQRSMGKLFDTTNMIIALHDRETDTFSLAYTSDQKDRYTTFPAGKTLTAYVIRTDRPLLVTAEDMDEMERKGLVETIGTPSEIWMAAPLRSMGTTIGAIVVQSYDDPGAYDDGDMEVLSFVAEQIGLFIDRARMVESLRESEELFRAVFETARDSIFVKDRELRYVRVNHAMEDLFGLSRDDILGRTDSELFGPKTGGGIERGDRRVLAGQVLEEMPKKPVRGSEHVFHTVKVPLRSASGEITGLCGIARDITERRRAEEEHKRLEQQMLEAQKMESLGIMAGGIAHDFNNILVAILGNAEMALEGGRQDSVSADRLRKIRSAALRASELARQMLAYAGRASFQVEVLDLGAMVRELYDIMRASIPRRIEIDCRAPEAPVPVRGDAVQIRQVVMNLITNAAEAIEGPGRIEIAVSLAERGETRCESLPEAPYGCSLLQVTDSGCGMEEEMVDRIFDPFFSTKFSGSGLGLSAVQGIMRSHDGTILVDSEVGRGTTFTAVFPRCRAASGGAEGPRPDQPGVSLTGGVLVVDDEEMVREVAGGMLGALGMDVTCADSGEAALDLLFDRGLEPALVMLDLTMPGMDGEETLRRIRSRRPDLPVIVFSGYSREDLRRRFEDETDVYFMQKPFTLEGLRTILAEVRG
jgi:PAS domain S-box-containing protein